MDYREIRGDEISLANVVPESMIRDSRLLCFLEEGDETFLDDLDQRVRSAVTTALPLYQGIYDFDENSELRIIEALSYLDCGRLDEMLVVLWFKVNREEIISRLNDDIKRKLETMSDMSGTMLEVFIKKGLLDALKTRYSAHKYSVSDFELACEYGHLHIAQYIFELGGVESEGCEAFHLSCINGHIDIAQWLYRISYVDIHYRNDYTFRQTCWKGEIKVAKWLYNLGGVDIHKLCDSAFCGACSQGHLEVVKWLHSLGGVDIHADNDYPFLNACMNGYIDVAQWLLSFGDVDNRVKEKALYLACCNGELRAAQWLYDHGELNLRSSLDVIFEGIAQRGHLHVVKWLYDIGLLDVHDSDEYWFRRCCGSLNSLKIAKWLNDECHVDIHADDEGAFIDACTYGNLDIAQWLYSLGGVNVRADGNEAYRSAQNRGHVLVVKWLLTILENERRTETAPVVRRNKSFCSDLLSCFR